jgi:hypothetical protein
MGTYTELVLKCYMPGDYEDQPKRKIKMKFNDNNYLKWGFTLLLFLFGTFCMLKSYGYCEEYEEQIENQYLLPQHRGAPVPVEDEYMYQYRYYHDEVYIPYAKRSNWGKGKPQEIHPYDDINAKRAEWQELYDKHHFDAVRTYTDAYNKVWWIPDLTLRQLGRDAWVAACGTAGGSTLSGRLVIAFAAMLSSYGLRCLDEWDYIQDKLYWSNYHFEQCAIYAQKLHG